MNLGGPARPRRSLVATTVGPPLRQGRHIVWRDVALFVLFLAPNVLFLGTFVYWPLLQQAYLSLTVWDMLAPEKLFVGLDNYTFLFGDPKFRRVLMNTAVFVAGGLAGTLALGLIFALLLNQRLRFRQGVRSLVFAPTVISGAAVGLVWIYIFDPRFGLMKLLLGLVGLPSPNWLLDKNWAMLAVLIVYVWKNVGYSTVVYLAGLQNIPAELYEAAAIDGASAWQRFRRITLPLLSPITFFIVVTTILALFQSFDIIFVMTRGGPVDATNTLIFSLYEEGFIAFNAGTAAAIGMILFTLMLMVTILQFAYAERRVHYQ
jgi:multiple sugar transport system permease protein/sn-glycerol 3-phosphate transport system permease protein